MIDRNEALKVFRGEYKRFADAREEACKNRVLGGNNVDGADALLFVRAETEDLASKLGIPGEELRRGIDL